MGKLFGTDGARGVANTKLTSETAFKLGQAAVEFLGTTIVVGKDTRRSGDMLECAVASGIMSAGGTVLQLGIIPTPAVALISNKLHADGGIVISASHNPSEYNGIKFFTGQGFKLPIELESRIADFALGTGIPAEKRPSGSAIGTRIPVPQAKDMYIEHAVKMVRDAGIDFSGWNISLDTAHGASSLTTASALRELGAHVDVENDSFTGDDINDGCGSTHLDYVRGMVARNHSDIGIAHDGDADRVLFCDGDGNEIDGDMVIATCGLDMAQRGRLPHMTVVSTIMCNLGLVHVMRAHDITVVRTPVGDRNVLHEMRKGGFMIGGEQSGHTIFLAHNNTGDGLITACQFLSTCVREGKSPSEAAHVMTRFPQVLVNVRTNRKQDMPDNKAIKDEVERVNRMLGDSGRVLVRPSGTEPLVRVMVESMDKDQAQKLADDVACVVKEELS